MPRAQEGPTAEEVLFGPVYKKDDIGIELLVGLSPNGKNDRNICELTDHTDLVFVKRDEMPEVSVVQGTKDTKHLFYVPEDVTPLELCSLIDNLYAENAYEGVEIKRVMTERLYGTVEHLGRILNKAEEQLPPDSVGKLDRLKDTYEATRDFFVGMQVDTTDIKTTSLIGFSDEEVDDRIARIILSIEMRGDTKLLERYMDKVMECASDGLQLEVQKRLEGETALALFTRGNKYLTDNLPVSKYFDKKYEEEHPEENEPDTIGERFLRQFDRFVKLINPSASLENYGTLLDDMHKAYAKVESANPDSLESAQVVFMGLMMKEISKYDGWISNFWDTIEVTAPSKVVESGEMACISRTALIYGLLVDNGWDEDSLYTLTIEGHTTLVAKTRDSYYLLDTGYTGATTHGMTAAFAMTKLDNFEDTARKLSDSQGVSKATLTFDEMLKGVTEQKILDAYQDYTGQVCEVYQGNRAIGLAFLNHLAIVYGNTGREDLQLEVLNQIKAIDPTNIVLEHQMERYSKRVERRAQLQRDFSEAKKAEAETEEADFQQIVNLYDKAYALTVEFGSKEDAINAWAPIKRLLLPEEAQLTGFKKLEDLQNALEIDAALTVLERVISGHLSTRDPHDYDGLISELMQRDAKLRG